MRNRQAFALAAAIFAADSGSAAPVSVLQCAPKAEPVAEKPAGPFHWATKWFKGSEQPADAPIASSAFGAGFATRPGSPMAAPSASPAGIGAQPVGPWRGTAATPSMPAMPPALPALPPRPVAPAPAGVTPEQFAATIAGQPATVPPVVANVETTLATSAAAEGRGDVAAARQILGQHLMLDPNSAVVLRELAHVEDRAGQLAEAERHYRASIGADPTSAAAVNDLALCQARQGRLESAAGTLRQAILMRPEKPLYRNNLATILVELGKAEEAREQLAAAYEPAVASYNLGLLLARSGETEAAAASFRDAIALDPAMAAAHAALARVAPAPAASPSIAAAPAREPMRVASLPAAAPADITPYEADASETTPIGPATPVPMGARSYPRLLPPVVGR